MDEVVAQIETDKVTVGRARASAGRVTEEARQGWGYGHGRTDGDDGVAERGKKVKEKREAKETKETKEASGPPAAVEVPSIGDSAEGAACVHVKPGQKVAMDEVIAQIETDKVTIDVRASTSGTVTEVLVAEGESGGAGRGVSRRYADRDRRSARPRAAAAERRDDFEGDDGGEEDADARRTGGESAERGRVRLARARRACRCLVFVFRVAERLKSSQNTYAMLTTFNEIDMSNVMQMRTEYKDAFLERHGVKLGFMSTFVTGGGKGVQEEPSVNAIIDGDEIVYRNYVDISVAVSAERLGRARA